MNRQVIFSIMEGCLDSFWKEQLMEKNHRGRPRLQYISQIKEEDEQELKRKASDGNLCKPINKLKTEEELITGKAQHLQYQSIYNT